MLVSIAEYKYLKFFNSPDLKNWTHLSDFGPAGKSDVPHWECPDIFELPHPHKEGDTVWVLKIDVGDGAIAGGSGSQYFLGHFDGKQFTNLNPPEKILWTDYGIDFYAAQSFNNMPDNRVVWLAWMNNWQYAGSIPAFPWRGAMTSPRELHLVVKTPQGLRLSAKTNQTNRTTAYHKRMPFSEMIDFRRRMIW